jgi:3-hydroxyisobutyrate dehydrogenase-like beta-hydroxyacid dehydrogenase
MSAVGFLGLGRMGAQMSARLIEHVDHLLVHDISHAAVQSIVGQGAQAAASAKGLGDCCEIVFLSLPTPAVVREAALGAGGVAEGSKVKLVCDLSTSGPRLAQELAEGLAAKGIASVDAPVSGGIKGAREGTLAIMAGGPEAAYERLRPLLERLGKPFYMGAAPGAGQAMKLVNNLLSLTAIAVTAEGMALGIKAGLDPARMIEVLNAGTGANSATRDKWPRSVLPRSFDFGFSAALSLKDTRLLLDEAAAMRVPMPIGSIIAELLDRTLAAYGPDADFTEIAKVVEGDAGLDPDAQA